MFASDSLIEAGMYPSRGELPSSAELPWEVFDAGQDDWVTDDGMVRDWFQIYDRADLYDVVLREEYTPVHSMKTLLVLLTVDEDDIFQEDERDGDEEDDA